MMIEGVLREHFGFDRFRAGQQAVVQALLVGRPALAVFPTGGGKSLCYQLPALLLDGVTLVVSPLIALMKDQVDALVAKGIAAARLDSSLTPEQSEQVKRQLAAGELKLLYLSPERMAQEAFRRSLKQRQIAMIAIDEAHCISEWGHNFRPDYLKLAAWCRELRVKRVLALTATATPEVAADIRKAFKIRAEDHVRLSFHRENLDLRVTPCAMAERKELLLERVRSMAGAAVVYVTRQETSEEVATFLMKQGVAARAYHAGLTDETRAAAQSEFMAGAVRVIVATIAFGMGIDKADIRAVFHYNPPKSFENYSQEIGRAGRDGAPAICEWLACGDDFTVLENFIHGDAPSLQALRNLIDRVLRLGDVFDVSVYDLSVSCDIRQTVVSTALAYLELDGVIEATAKFHATISVCPLLDLPRLLAGYDARKSAFLKKFFAFAESGRKWLTFDLDATALHFKTTRGKIVDILETLAAAGDVVLKRGNVRQGYRLLETSIDIRKLADGLHARFQLRERADLGRLRGVMDLAQSRDCLTAGLVGHFGEVLAEPCGHCDRCRGVPAQPLMRMRFEIKDADWARIQAVKRERISALATPRQLARFLCALPSPAMSRSKLSRHDAYGLLTGMPFGEVLALLEGAE